MSLRKAFLDSVRGLLEDRSRGAPRIAIGRKWYFKDDESEYSSAELGDNSVIWSRRVDEYRASSDVMLEVVAKAQQDLDMIVGLDVGKLLLKKADGLSYSVLLLPPSGSPEAQFSPIFLRFSPDSLKDFADGGFDSTALLTLKETSFFATHISLAVDVIDPWIGGAQANRTDDQPEDDPRVFARPMYTQQLALPF